MLTADLHWKKKSVLFPWTVELMQLEFFKGAISRDTSVFKSNLGLNVRERCKAPLLKAVQLSFDLSLVI